MSKYKLVEVMRGDDWIPRNAIHFNNDGSVVVVNNEEEQLNDDYIVSGSNVRFLYWREIKQPTWKPFPDSESMEHLKNCWFRFKGDTRQFITTNYEPYYGEVFKFDDNWRTKEQLFEYFEVQLNGKWQPVGVLDNIQKQD